MIVGHYAASFLGKSYAPAVPLWHLVFAAQLVDFVWGFLILLGVEYSEIVPGATKAFPFLFSYIPYSHSVVMLVFWTVSTYALYGLINGRNWGRGALVFSAVVASHWFADFLVHDSDLPLTLAENVKFGLGWWNYPLFEFVLEACFLFLALYVYSRTNSVPLHRIWRVDIWIVLAMLGIHGYFYFLPYVPSIHLVAFLVLLGYSFVTWLSYYRPRAQ
jgi:hypothetical protein